MGDLSWGNGGPYRLLGHRFAWPLFIRYGGWGTLHCGVKDMARIPFILKMGAFELRVFTGGMGGTYNTSSLSFQWKIMHDGKTVTDEIRELKFCWRWDLTAKRWNEKVA